MSLIKLQSCDGEIFTIDRAAAKQTGVIRTLIDECDLCADRNKEAIVPLPNVHSDTLKIIVKWLTHHRDGKMSIDRKSDDNKWDADLLNVDKYLLIELIMSAHYMDIKGLYEVLCQKFADMLAGKSPSQVRQLFHIPRDFTKKEMARLHQERKWLADMLMDTD